MSDTYPNRPFRKFYYGEQVYHYMVQFMSIFSGMQVSVGKSDSNPDGGLIYVPVRYGATDKVVEWIYSSQTANKPLRLPVMAAKVISLELAPELRKGMRTEEAKTRLPRGGSLPDDLKVIRQMQPNPAKMMVELAVLTTNNKNRFEILEQIMLLFDPDVQIFTSDDYKDHYKLNRVEMIPNVNFEEEYPMGTSEPLFVDTYTFAINAYFRLPIDLKESYVKSIRLRLDAVSSLPASEAVIELNNIGNAGDILFDIDDLDIPEN